MVEKEKDVQLCFCPWHISSVDIVSHIGWILGPYKMAIFTHTIQTLE